ncbi:RNA polymerase factor sigma-54 [Adlercreutzia faecimuris]|uniref:RNA polymerase factor sigma-54 n=1 Tax=Adlercreutzia faecimuris TaxID=2897341 RepID=A0ABS9WE27_9ACTN|nr:RNA polymerase factor sigma-54 [Adlercreutzia sp. JBNU-10]MCI2241122.1 RNA polymerase factor sigma-54 [Adlercreutzia sp. JBNU-10]
MHQGLIVEQSQRIQLTTEVRQGIAVMAMSALELREFVRNRMEENPFLVRADEADAVPGEGGRAGAAERRRRNAERYGGDPADGYGDSPCAGRARGDGAWDGSAARAPRADVAGEAVWERGADAADWEADRYGLPSSFAADADPDGIFGRCARDEECLEDQIERQMAMELRDPRDLRIAARLLEGLDERGYLRMDTDIVADQMGVTPNRVERVLHVMQTCCEPAGIGARSLQECLVAQLQARGADDPAVLLIVEEHLGDLAAGRMAAVAAAVGVTPADVRRALDVIGSLDPRPGSRFVRAAPAVRPEAAIVAVPGGGYEARMDEDLLPRVVVDGTYRDLARSQRADKKTLRLLEAMLHEAEGVVRAVDLRKASVLALAQLIAEEEAAFFDEGLAAMRPLTMAEAARQVGVSEATVSRVVNGTFLDTPRGVLEMRYFFHSGVGGAEGETSSLAVKQAIRELVAAEDARSPLSDAELADALEGRGMAVSRRTVNKYRTALGIPSQAHRREYR